MFQSGPGESSAHDLGLGGNLEGLGGRKGGNQALRDVAKKQALAAETADDEPQLDFTGLVMGEERVGPAVVRCLVADGDQAGKEVAELVGDPAVRGVVNLAEPFGNRRALSGRVVEGIQVVTDKASNVQVAHEEGA